MDGRLSFYVYGGMVYVVSVGVLYLWGYWSTFGINILQYMSFGDAVKIAAYPITSVFVTLAVGAVIGEVISPLRSLPPGGGRNTLVGRVLNRHKRPLAALYALGTIALATFGPPLKWLIVPVLVAPLIYFPLKEHGFLAQVLPGDSVRSVTIFLLAVLPLYSYGRVRFNADHVLSGTAYRYVLPESAQELGVPPGVVAKGTIKYLGGAGDHAFLLLGDNRTLAVVRIDGGKALLIAGFARN